MSCVVENKPGADAKVEELQRDLELYKLLAEGAEDPRVADLSKKATEWEQKYAALNKQFETMQAENDNQGDECGDRARCGQQSRTVFGEPRDRTGHRLPRMGGSEATGHDPHPVPHAADAALEQGRGREEGADLPEGG